MLPTHVLRNFPTFGSVLRIIVDNVAEKQAIQCLRPGQHVKFLNLFFQINLGLWNAAFSPSTKMQYTMSREMQSFTPQRFLFNTFFLLCDLISCYAEFFLRFLCTRFLTNSKCAEKSSHRDGTPSHAVLVIPFTQESQVI